MVDFRQGTWHSFGKDMAQLRQELWQGFDKEEDNLADFRQRI